MFEKQWTGMIRETSFQTLIPFDKISANNYSKKPNQEL